MRGVSVVGFKYWSDTKYSFQSVAFFCNCNYFVLTSICKLVARISMTVDCYNVCIAEDIIV